MERVREARNPLICRGKKKSKEKGGHETDFVLMEVGVPKSMMGGREGEGSIQHRGLDHPRVAPVHVITGMANVGEQRGRGRLSDKRTKGGEVTIFLSFG